MRKLILALLTLAWSTSALAQVQIGPPWPQTLQSNTVVGNLSPVARPAAGISLAQLKAALYAGETPVNDANYAVVAGTNPIIVYTAISAARTVTLLPAGNYNPGTQFTIFDRSGSASATNTISVAPTGADLIDGANTSLVVLLVPYTGAVVESDGISKWTLLAGAINASGINSGSLALARIAAIATDTYIGNAIGSSAAPTAVSRSNCTGNNSALQYSTSSHTEGCNANLANLTIADQTMSGGANITSGSQTTGNITIDCGKVPLQFITNGGAYTITAPTNDGSCIILVTNNGTAGATTFSGFSVGSNTGDALDTTNAHKFSIFIWRINSVSGYRVAAHQ